MGSDQSAFPEGTVPEEQGAFGGPYQVNKFLKLVSNNFKFKLNKYWGLNEKQLIDFSYYLKIGIERAR